MWQILGWILVLAMVIAAFKIAIFVLILAGLIFRTRDTIGLLAFGGALTGFAAHPLIGIVLTVLVIGLAIYFNVGTKDSGGSIKQLRGPD